jgi:GrpB-like predicted nucleotidyltransferase (UPF0157 family)
VDRAEQRVRVVPHDLRWAKAFAEEREALEPAIGRWASGGIHHVGSTAIPGVDAEPVVDILLGADPAAPPAQCLSALAGLEYARLDSGELQRWSKPPRGPRLFELHLVPVTDARFTETLAFRDLLRADVQVAIGYAGLKRDLARRYGADRAGYAVAKSELVQATLIFLRARASGPAPLLG